MMKLRQFQGAILAATDIYVFVEFGPGPEDYIWLPVSKNAAKLITAEAKDPEREDGDAKEIDAEWDGKDLHVGGASLRETEEEQVEPG